jgi:probable addiction module antidote protein
MAKHPAPQLKPFDAAEYLTDDRTIAQYLNAAAELGDPAVLLDAFAAVGRAKGMAELARKAGLGRESLYKALAPGAHPRYDTIFKVAQALGVGFHFAAPTKTAKPRKSKLAAKAAPARAPTKKALSQTRRNEQRAAAKS